MSLSPPPRPPTPRGPAALNVSNVAQPDPKLSVASPISTLLPLNSPFSPLQQPAPNTSSGQVAPATVASRRPSVGAGNHGKQPTPTGATPTPTPQVATTPAAAPVVTPISVIDPYSRRGTVATLEDEIRERRRKEKEERRRERKDGNGGGGILSLNYWTSVAGVSTLVGIASMAVMVLVALDQFENSYRDATCESILAATLEGDRWVLLRPDEGVSEQLTMQHRYADGYLSTKEFEQKNAPKGRLGHAACAVNGVMYIHGGLHGVPTKGSPTAGSSAVLDDLWSYEPTTKIWHQLSFKTEDPQPGARLYHSLVPLKNNRSFLLFGGFNNETTRDGHDSYNDIWEFDTVNRSWTKVETNRLMTKAVYNEYKEAEDVIQAAEQKVFNVAMEKRLEVKRVKARADRQIANDKAMAEYTIRNSEREARNAARGIRRLERHQRVTLLAEQEEAARVKAAQVAVEKLAAIKKAEREAAESRAKKAAETVAANASQDNNESCANQSEDPDNATTENTDGDDEPSAANTSSNESANDEDEYEDCTGSDCEDAEDEVVEDQANATTAPSTTSESLVEVGPEVEDDEDTEAVPTFDETPIVVEDDHSPYRPPRHRTMFPYPRGAHEATLSPCGEYLYVFGGHRQIFSDPSAELWRFSLKNQYWEEVTPRNESFPHLPSRRVGFSLGTTGDTAYLFGGACVHGSISESNGQCSDTWEFNFTSRGWTYINTSLSVTQSMPAAFTSPGPRRAGHSIAVVDGILFLFGGVYLDNNNKSPAGSRLYDDLWAFTPTNSTSKETSAVKGTWAPVFPNYRRGPRPGPTFGHSMVAIGRSILVFGGRHRSIDHHGSNELWEYKVLKA